MEEEIYVMKIALDNEKKGYNMYLEAGANSKNKLVRDMFKYLATQELYHMQRIEEFNKSMSGTVEFFSPELGENIIHFDEAKQLFNKTIAEWKEEFKSEDDLQALNTALDFEKEGYEYYKKHSDNTNDLNLKKFFEFLCKEEDLHFHLIQNMIGYIENPMQFNADEEDWFFEG